MERSEQLITTCLKNARTPFEKSDIYYLLMLRQSLSSQYPEAISTARKGLTLLGFEFPDDDLDRRIGENMGWIAEHFAKNGIAAIYDNPTLTDPKKLAILKILDNLSMPTYVSGQVNLWILHVLLKVRLSIEYGNAPETGYAFSELGLIFCILGNYDSAFPCSDLSRRLGEKFERQSLRHKGRSLHLIANYVSPWRTHYRDTESINRESHQASLDSGEVIFTGYTIFHPFYNRFYSGSPTLPGLLEELPANLHFAKKIKHDLAYNSLQGMNMLLRNLTDENGSVTVFESQELSEQQFLEECAAGKDYYSICTYNVFKAKILYLYKQFEAAQQSLDQAKDMIAALSGNAAGITTFHFTLALVSLALCAKDELEEQEAHLEVAMTSLAQFEIWSKNCPENFRHKYLLIKAELARLEGEDLDAMRLYNEAIESAQEYGYVNEEALTNELAARFMLGRGSVIYGRPHLFEAHHNYLRWGATRKALLLEEEFPIHFSQKLESNQSVTMTGMDTASHFTSSNGSNELDFHSIVKASQTLSGEIVLENLLTKMVDILLENAGAQKAVLVLNDEGHWQVEATGILGEGATVMQGIPVDKTSDAPLPVLNYLIRSGKTLSIDDVGKETRFQKDAYILNNHPKSIFGMPLMHQGKIAGILYLENNVTTGAFKPRLVETLQLLSSQMAVSIKNAQLYDHLSDLNKAYARFVPRQFLRTLGLESILDVRLGEQKQQEMTVLFSDIREYATLSETMSPEDNFNFINAYLRRLGPCITSNGGFISQYYGDGIMSLFPNPEDGMNAAIGMQQQLLKYNEARAIKGRTTVKIGIGIHTGSLMLGVIGDEKRHDVTVISDVVNSASRLEGLTKIFGVSIIASEDTMAGISHSYRYNSRFLGRVQVKGREGVMNVYEFFDGDEPHIAEHKRETAALFRQGLEEFFAKNFAEAALNLKKVITANPADRVASHYLKRAAHFLIEGTGDEWTGVEKMDEK